MHHNPPTADPDGGDSGPSRIHCGRLGILFWSFVVAFAGVGLWLVRVHAGPDSRLTLEEMAHIGRVELRVPRGQIRDREGELLAKDRRAGSVWADPRQIDDPDRAAEVLGALFNVPVEELRARLEPRDRSGNVKKFVWVKRWLTDAEMAVYENLDPAYARGLDVRHELVRFYPEGELASHVLGFVNREGVGCEGVELAFDHYLRCTPGMRKMRVDARRRLLESLTLEHVEEEGGESVYLTLDKTIQRYLEKGLDRAMEEHQAPRAMGMIMDVNTGAILALACRPAYDPNEFGSVPPELYKNRALVDVFEPGSVFKIVPIAAALERGLVRPEMLIDCENGSFNPYGHRIKDFYSRGIEPLTVCFALSSNVAVIKIGALLGPEGMEHWTRRFGFGEKASEQAFATESRGLFRPRSEWSRLTMGSLPMGQEIAVTMPQLARSFAVIANGGLLVEPYVVERVVGRDGALTYEHQSGAVRRVISEQTAATMRELCHLVVTYSDGRHHGTGRHANIPEYRVGGKTGTAQIAKAGGGGYYKDKYTSVFAGFAPVGDPRVVAVIVVEEPRVGRYGGSVCGPVFSRVVRDTLIRLDVPLDPVQAYMDSKLALKEVEAAFDTAWETAYTPFQQGDLLDGLELVSLDPAAHSEGPRLRDLAGMTKRQVKEYVDFVGLRWDVRGAGRVVSQDPPPGTPLRDITICRLVFANQPPEDQTDETDRPAKTARM